MHAAMSRYQPAGILRRRTGASGRRFKRGRRAGDATDASGRDSSGDQRRGSRACSSANAVATAATDRSPPSVAARETTRETRPGLLRTDARPQLRAAEPRGRRRRPRHPSSIRRRTSTGWRHDAEARAGPCTIAGTRRDDGRVGEARTSDHQTARPRSRGDEDGTRTSAAAKSRISVEGGRPDDLPGASPRPTSARTPEHRLQRSASVSGSTRVRVHPLDRDRDAGGEPEQRRRTVPPEPSRRRARRRTERERRDDRGRAQLGGGHGDRQPFGRRCARYP